jgi:hypothetical protein
VTAGAAVCRLERLYDEDEPDTFHVERATFDDAGILDCLSAAFDPYRAQYTPAAYEDTVLTRETLRPFSPKPLSSSIEAAIQPEGIRNGAGHDEHVPKGRNGPGDRCGSSNVRSAILSHTAATTFVSERSATSPDGCIKQRVCRLLSSKKGDGQRNRRLDVLSFRFLNRLNENVASVPRSVPKQCA